MRYISGAFFILFLSLFSFRPVQDGIVTGTITDGSSGSPLSGVSITLVGSSAGTISGSAGEFQLTVPGKGAILKFDYIGYKTVNIKVKKAGTPLVVKMYADATFKLEEVVVTGYENTVADQLQGSVSGISGGGHRRAKTLSRSIGHNPAPNFNTEEYDGITENRFMEASKTPLSTFSIDVDAASYSNMRRFLQMGQLPPAGAVRIEEMINYFNYDYPQPEGQHPFSINTEMSNCPWNSDNKIVMIGLQGKKIPLENIPASNLVFLIDVSGSMMAPNKLQLVQASMKLLVNQLREQDRAAIVVYAGNAGLVLPSTSGAQKQKIRDAIDQLEAGGSTAGGEGIRLAYKVARQNFIKGANNRVILCTDGDFNVGASSDADLEQIIEEERESGVYLTVLGYGMGNYKDSKMQKLADKGNGNHAYIDNVQEARKVLVKEFGGTLFTIAKDVKLQVEFNPAKIQAYRLIGYENRILNKEDFNNDKKDAGELGSGHTVTALYEVIPVGVKSKFIEATDDLKYQGNTSLKQSSAGNEIMTVKFRYKSPDEKSSRLIEHAVAEQHLSIEKTSDNFRFVAAIAQFGMLLTHSEFMQESSFASVMALAKNSLGNDAEGYRHECINLLTKARELYVAKSENKKLDDE